MSVPSQTGKSAISIDLSRFPAELRELPQWVCWRLVAKEGKPPTKVPVSVVTGSAASSTNPKDWTTCAAACSAYERRPNLSGVGFVFTSATGVVGIDLDNAVTADGAIEPWAQAIVDDLDSYTELSPSGRGLHIFARGVVPPGGNKRGSHATVAVELYHTGRYFTVTGRALRDGPVQPRQAAIDRLHARIFGAPAAPAPSPAPAAATASVPADDRELLDRALRSKSGAEIRALLAGDTSAHNLDHSSADLALCGHLAFWTGRDAGRIDRMFRSSGLMRPKWDSARGAETYGQRTIAQAIARCTDVYTPRPARAPNPSDAKKTGGVHVDPPCFQGPAAAATPDGVGVPPAPPGDRGEVSAGDSGYIGELNARHAVVMVGGRAAVMTEGYDPALQRRTLAFGGPQDLMLLYAHRTVPVGDPPRPKCIADLWMKSPGRRQYDGIVFLPGSEAPPGWYNLWRGWGTQPVAGEPPRRTIDFFLQVLCAGNEDLLDYLLCWLAHLVQRPAELPETALVLRGPEGTGKGTLMDIVSTIVGREHYIELTSMVQLTGKFSGHLADKLVINANEATWGGDKSAEGTLKGLITDKNRAMERKGQDIISVANYARVIVSSNEDWPVARGQTDRRLVVFDLSPARRGDHAYYAAVRAELAAGGYQALHQMLLDVDLAGWHPRQIPEVVRGLGWELKVRSGPSELQWWFDCLDQGYIWSQADAAQEWPDLPVARQQVVQAYTLWCRDRSKRAASSADLGSFLKGNSKRGAPNMGVCDGPRARAAGEQQRTYRFADLDTCRAKFAEFMGFPVEEWARRDVVDLVRAAA